MFLISNLNRLSYLSIFHTLFFIHIDKRNMSEMLYKFANFHENWIRLKIRKYSSLIFTFKYTVWLRIKCSIGICVKLVTLFVEDSIETMSTNILICLSKPLSSFQNENVLWILLESRENSIKNTGQNPIDHFFLSHTVSKYYYLVRL